MGASEKEEPPDSEIAALVNVLTRRMGGFKFLSGMVHSGDAERACTAACVLTLQARYEHEYR
jgi:hypothetical protein